jgi:hypothetical protein
MDDEPHHCSPHSAGVSIGTADRGKVTSMWCLSEERARDLIAQLTERIGKPDHEFISSAEHIDTAARELFQRPGGVVQIDLAMANGNGRH